MKNVVLLGATGSIGDNTLAVIRKFSNRFKLLGVIAQKNIEKLENIIKEFSPELICLTESVACDQLKARHPECKVLEGMEGAELIASHQDADIVVSGISGGAGLRPTLAAITAGKMVAIANKEPLVMAGQIMMDAAKKNKATILPVDSEHSAIYQCISGFNGENKGINKIFLTASGGPFRKHSFEDLKKVNVSEALKHPTWNMGTKITIDSSTLMNKALEILEATHLFSVNSNKVQVIVQPSSIIHSMVEFLDGSTIAQLGIPSMELPIQYALLYPERLSGNVTAPNWVKLGSLQFEAPNPNLTRALDFAYQVAEEGGAMGVVLNAANEIAVQKFLDKNISFLQIYDLIETALHRFKGSKATGLAEIFSLDRQIRQEMIIWNQ